MRLKRISALLCVLLMLLFSTPNVWAIGSTLLGRLSAPVSAPAQVSSVSDDAVFFPILSGITAGQHLGTPGTGTTVVRFSNNDGVTWGSGVTNPFSGIANGFSIVGERILVLQDANPCVVHYSDNNTTSWTTVSLTGLPDCLNSGIFNNLQCSGSLCFIAGASGGNILIYRSQDTGASWTNVHTSSGYNNGVPSILFNDGTNIIVGGNFISGCSASNEGRIVTSTDGGTTWNTIARNCQGLGDSFSIAYFDGTFYYIVAEIVGSTHNVCRTTNLTSCTYTTISVDVVATGCGAVRRYTAFLIPTIYYACGNADGGILFTSTDGGTFTSIFTSSNANEVFGQFLKVDDIIFFGSRQDRYYVIQ